MKKISIITSKKYLKSKQYDSLIEILNSKDIEYEILNIDENLDKKIANSNLIISVGGDGTALRAMKIAWLSNLPVLNIGSGRIGYLVNSLNDIDFNKILKATTKAISLGDYEGENIYYKKESARNIVRILKTDLKF